MLFVLVAPITPTMAFVGPVAYLTEQVYADYDTNGSVSSDTYPECNDGSNPCRFGYSEVALPNANDTLQTVRINLSGTDNTALNSKELYIATASSYQDIWHKTKIYVNDSDFGANNQNYYNITNTNVAPTIEFNITTYSNGQGGLDLHDYDNIGAGSSTNNMSFTVTAKNPSSSIALNGVAITLAFDTDTGAGSEDSVNLTSTTAGTLTDSDGDTYNDQIIWNGNIAAGATQTFTLTADLTETVNFNNGDTSINLDTGLSDKGVESGYTQATTLTGLTIDSAYSRGPIRQGIDLAEQSSGNAWEVRAFVTILASNSTEVGGGDVLTYNISSWSIYNVSVGDGNLTGVVQSGTFSPQNFTADVGPLYTTDGTYSSSTARAVLSGEGKPYVASSFDWHVIWNETLAYYVSYINTTLDLPTLYKVDQVTSKSIGGYISLGATSVFNITDETMYQGDNNALGKSIVINSIVPRNTTGGTSRTAFDINETSVVVYWYNFTASSYEVIKMGAGTDNNVTVTVTEPIGGSDGSVVVSINNLSATNVSSYLLQNDSILLFYEVIAPSDLDVGDAFSFSGNVTVTSLSGTPETESLPDKSLSTSGRQLIGYKDLFVTNPAQPTVVNGTLVVQVVGEVINGIKFVDYVPLGTNFTCNTSSVSFYNSTDGITWSPSDDINVEDKGNVTLADGTVVHACEYSDSVGAGWSLSGNASVKVVYAVNITNSGLYEMPMAIAGFDPALGEGISASALGVIRVNVPEPLVDPEIRQGDFLVSKSVVVGNPVVWTKDFEVYNPNSQYVDAKFSTDIFEDATTGYATYLNEVGEEITEEVTFTTEDGKRRMVWESRLYPLETRTYDLRILTPPITETDRDVEILDVLEDKMVELRMSIFLRSLAKETYENVQFNLPISSANVISITDSDGNSIPYSGGSSIRVTIPELGPQEMKEVVIVYKQSYPKIIVTPNKESYDLEGEVSLDILVIHGGEEVSYPYIETEVYTPDRDLVYANVRDLGHLEPISKTNVSEQFTIPLGAPAGTYIAETRLKSDMATLATGTGNFYVSGSSGFSAAWTNYVMLLFCLGLLYLGSKRVKSLRQGRAVDENASIA